jgi:hypothetical protein
MMRYLDAFLASSTGKEVQVKILVPLTLVLISLGWLPAEAGGLFGEGGLFRGSVGEFLDKHVEQPILTPAARAATVAVAAAAGATAGAHLGAPEAGAALGTAVGQAINDAAAGKH